MAENRVPLSDDEIAHISSNCSAMMGDIIKSRLDMEDIYNTSSRVAILEYPNVLGRVQAEVTEFEERLCRATHGRVVKADFTPFVEGFKRGRISTAHFRVLTPEYLELHKNIWNLTVSLLQWPIGAPNLALTFRALQLLT